MGDDTTGGTARPWPVWADRLIVFLAIGLFLFQSVVGALTYRQVRILAVGLHNAASSRLPEQTAGGLSIGAEAPGFTLSNSEGDLTSLGDYQQTTRLLVFGSLQCPACQELYPTLADLQSLRPDLQIMLITNGSPEENSQLGEQHGFSFPVLTHDSEVVQAYQVLAVPRLFIIDAQGTIVNSVEGAPGDVGQLLDVLFP